MPKGRKIRGPLAFQGEFENTFLKMMVMSVEGITKHLICYYLIGLLISFSW
jgi:hypothetical protein